VILGHLIPAGTGFHLHQDAHIRIHDQAIREQEEAKARMLAARQDMLTDTEIAARRAQEDNESPQAPSLADLTADDL
jgi:DNA-directed RNA polymerase subunit beta'